MRATLVRQYGSPRVVELTDLPEPTAEPGHVVVDVRAAAVNFPDVLVLRDAYQISVPLPFTPGSEVAGVVREVGAGVDTLKVGDRIMGAMLHGAFAERVAMPAASLSRVPEGVDWFAAAAFGVVYATAYHALRSPGQVEAGDTVAVLGAAGGVGLAAVDVGRALGARVIACASSEAKLAVCRAVGAAETICYPREDLKQRLRELTDGAGVDVVVDPVGGQLAEAALRAVGWRGRFVSVGFASGEIPRLPLNILLLRGAELCSLNLGVFLANESKEGERNQREMFELLARGELRPHVSAVHPLEETADALEAIEQRRAIGKLIIDPTC